MRLALTMLLLASSLPTWAEAAEPRSVSGIYPHLVYWNREGECGTGAVVPWADRLWVITYAPHKPSGSTDKLYEITDAFEMTTRPESIGGTPANRMIHRESEQLFIGPYAIDKDRRVRVIGYDQMFGRPTGNARHLFDPAGKIYCATMEEGLYEIDVKSLAVTKLWADEADKNGSPKSNLPGYHGKGLYSGQGRVIYANNGDHAKEALGNPAVPSGVLAEWDGRAEAWTVVRRNQFTEVTGPGGIYGSDKPETDPIWTIGWDHRSLILMMLDRGTWHTYRLPKGSHSYDGAHGWNTEWPRIRDVGESDLLMTMHGTFWKFPKTFSAQNAKGIRPRSNYLKVIGDFTRWHDRIVFGCDDSAANEFLNKRAAKGKLAGPERSHSNLWFVKPEQLDDLGPAQGTGAVWLKDAMKAGEWSDPYLFAGYERRGLYIHHTERDPVTFTFEVDRDGTGKWEPWGPITVGSTPLWLSIPPDREGEWIRVKIDREVKQVSVVFTGSNADPRTTQPAERFAGLAPFRAKDYIGGTLHSGGKEAPLLRFAAVNVVDHVAGEPQLYELDGDLNLKPSDDAKQLAWMKTNAAVPESVLEADAGSLIYTDWRKRRYRIPSVADGNQHRNPVPLRICREICTERDLFSAGGTFFELPAENAGGFTKIRAVASHPYRVTDYTSWRGLLAISGVSSQAAPGEHIVRSADGKAALWLGAVDDLWKIGKPTGRGGPWTNAEVEPDVPSDPYLFRGYDRKHVGLSHDSKRPVAISVELDISGEGLWVPYKRFDVPPGELVQHDFPPELSAYWVRVVADKKCRASAVFVYD
jgi:hypothetical protein